MYHGKSKIKLSRNMLLKVSYFAKPWYKSYIKKIKNKFHTKQRNYVHKCCLFGISY